MPAAEEGGGDGGEGDAVDAADAGEGLEGGEAEAKEELEDGDPLREVQDVDAVPLEGFFFVLLWGERVAERIREI